MGKNSPENSCGQEAFKQLFFEHSRSLHNFLYFKSGNEELAEDLTQEAFLRLWKECQNVPPQKAKSFLFTVANNLFLDHIKHQKVVQKFQIQNSWKISSIENPQYLMEVAEFKAKLEAAIGELPEKSRVVFLLNRIEKRTYKEIAELLDISVKAVEKRMHKALVALRKLTDNI